MSKKEKTNFNKKISKEDVDKYISISSDFAFELKAFNKLHELESKYSGQCEYQHSGTYTDTITGRSREFDIRFSIQSSKYKVIFAIECKNIDSELRPLVAHCVKRTEKEAYHHAIENRYSTVNGIQKMRSTGYVRVSKLTENSIYGHSSNRIVCKSLNQVWKKQENNKDVTGKVVANDGEIYDKWAQAVSSAHDILNQECYQLSKSDSDLDCQTVIIPILVVPDNSIYKVVFDETGNVKGDSEIVEYISYFLGTELKIDTTRLKHNGEADQPSYTLSHLEVVSLNKLHNIIEAIYKCLHDIELGVNKKFS